MKDSKSIEMTGEYFDAKIRSIDENHNRWRRNQSISKVTKCDNHQWALNWPMISLLIGSHLASMVGIKLAIFDAKISTLIFYFVLIQFGATGIICGAHRLWTHRTYRAHFIWRTFLMICQTLALQFSILDWSHIHRVHHKYSDTDADPHNANRGFFFSQIGWLCVHPHPKYLEHRNEIRLNDLIEDPVVRFQHRFYLPLVGIITFLLPTLIPWYFWSESLSIAFFVNIFRHLLSVHQTSLVNSAAHIFGSRPYNQYIEPTENRFSTYVTMGEAYHNYHHSFPWDYSASEFGWDRNYNPMTAVIDFAALLGLVWERKKVPKEMILKRIQRCGSKRGDEHRSHVDVCDDDCCFNYNLLDDDGASRRPKSLLLDTIIGFVSLFWAFWILLLLRLYTHHYFIVL
ncbi:hypothetical protein NH340_JMT00423 [Sarcoptes scabiei]|nr:hypothetical protein NH340_JMT00423 [Sarcoptes scabiei]